MPTSFFNLKRNFCTQRGFSILEVLITAAIIGIITGMVTLQYGSFNNSILLKNQAFEVALDLREMQTRALSAVGDNATFRNPYGVYFSVSTPGQYTLFLDDGDNIYEAGEEIETRKLDSRFRFSELCDATDCSLNTLSVTFVRPNFDAIMSDDGSVVSNGEIHIISLTNTDAERTVVVNAAGQIIVE